MKTKLIILIIGIFLVGTVVAGVGLFSIDKEADYLDRTQETTLSNVGINNWSYEDKEDTDYMKRCLISPSEFNLPCSPLMKTYWENCTIINTNRSECNEWTRINYTTKEKSDMLDEWEEERMKGIANVRKERIDKADSVLVNVGNVVVK